MKWCFYSIRRTQIGFLLWASIISQSFLQYAVNMYRNDTNMGGYIDYLFHLMWSGQYAGCVGQQKYITVGLYPTWAKFFFLNDWGDGLTYQPT